MPPLVIPMQIGSLYGFRKEFILCHSKNAKLVRDCDALCKEVLNVFIIFPLPFFRTILELNLKS